MDDVLDENAEIFESFVGSEFVRWEVGVLSRRLLRCNRVSDLDKSG